MATILCINGGGQHTRLSLLKNAGYDVLTATTECASLAVGRLPSVDAVILDSRSPISNLPALATELKCERPALPIVLVTDAGVHDAPEPLMAFDHIISRLDGPVVLLATLREVIVGVISIAVAKQWAEQTVKLPRDGGENALFQFSTHAGALIWGNPMRAYHWIGNCDDTQMAADLRSDSYCNWGFMVSALPWTRRLWINSHDSGRVLLSGSSYRFPCGKGEA